MYRYVLALARKSVSGDAQDTYKAVFLYPEKLSRKEFERFLLAAYRNANIENGDGNRIIDIIHDVVSMMEKQGFTHLPDEETKQWVWLYEDADAQEVEDELGARYIR